MTYLTWKWFCCLPFEENIIFLCILAISTLILPSLSTPNTTHRTTQALFLFAHGTNCWGNCLQFLVLTQSLSFNVWLTVNLPIRPPILQDLAFPSHTPSSPFISSLPPSLHRQTQTSFHDLLVLFWPISMWLGLRFVSYMFDHFSMAASDDAVASARPLAQALHLLDLQHVSWNGCIFHCFLCQICSFSFGVLFSLW